MEPMLKKEHSEHQMLACLHKVEGMFLSYAITKGLEKHLSMCNSGSHLSFELYFPGQSVMRSKDLDRYTLEELNDLDLTNVIISALKSVDQTHGGVPFKEHTNYPSRYSIGEKVKIFLMPEGAESFPGFTGFITAVHFTAGKVRYDVEIKFYGEHSTRIYNLDSVLVRDIEYGSVPQDKDEHS